MTAPRRQPRPEVCAIAETPPPNPPWYLRRNALQRQWLNRDPAARLTDEEVALLQYAGFFRFLENGWAAIRFETLAAAELAPDVVVHEPFIIRLGSQFFTLSYRGACEEKGYYVFCVRRSDAIDTVDSLRTMEEPARAKILAEMPEERRAAAVALLFELGFL